MECAPFQSARSTRFARISPIAARGVLSIVVIGAWLLVAISVSPSKMGFADAPSRGPGDIALYRAEAERIRDGESYYQAAKAELTVRGYPTRSILNWRTPLPVWLVGALPAGYAQALIVALAALALCFAAHAVAKAFGLWRALATLFLLTGALFPVILDGPYLMSEVWCGVLVALSIACFAIERRAAGLMFALGALFIRELAAPYCLVCVLFALRERKWSELRVWLAGAISYAAFYTWHLTEVLPLIDSAARSHSSGWVQLGGAAFMISLVQMNVYLLLLPQWVSALYLALALLGFASMERGWGSQAAWTACLYTIAFGVVGQPFNQYWGAAIAPLFCFGAAQGIAALADLFRAARLPLAATWSTEDAAA